MHWRFWKICVDKLSLSKEETSKIAIVESCNNGFVVYTWSEAFYLALKPFAKPSPKRISVTLNIPSKTLNLKNTVNEASEKLEISPKIRIRKLIRKGGSMEVALELLNEDADEFLIFLAQKLGVIRDGGAPHYGWNVGS